MKKQLMATAVVSSMVLAGCATTPGTTTNNTIAQNKAVIGALLGAAAGAGISKATGGEETGRDAAIGAAVGAGVGYYMQQQAKQLQQQTAGTGVDVVLDPNTNDIKLTMPSNITFPTAQASIQPQFQNTLNSLASTMAQYNQTKIVVMGHTDNVPINTAQYPNNQVLSEARAYAVASYLNNRGVAANRISTVAYGESRPIATNDTAEGRAMNRRVEIKINAPDNVS